MHILHKLGPVVQKLIRTNPRIKFLTHVLVSNLLGNDISCKFGINKVYSLKIQIVL